MTTFPADISAGRMLNESFSLAQIYNNYFNAHLLGNLLVK